MLTASQRLIPQKPSCGRYEIFLSKKVFQIVSGMSS